MRRAENTRWSLRSINLASQIGVDVMKKGGNAVDAAVAVALALAVVYPEAGNLGGGGFMLIRFKDGRTTAIDYREMAPAAATRNVYVDEKGELDQRRRFFDGRLSRFRRSGNHCRLELRFQKIRLEKNILGAIRRTFAQNRSERLRFSQPAWQICSKHIKENLEKYEDSKRIF